MVHYTKEQRAKMLNEARQRLTQALSTEPKSIHELKKNKVITWESLASLTFIMPNSGRSFPNKHFMEWHKEKLAELSAMLLENEIKRFGSIQIRIKMVFCHGDLRRRDSDNQCSSIMDLLVDSGIIDDDNWLIVREKLIKDYYDKNNARCEIKIETIGS